MNRHYRTYIISRYLFIILFLQSSIAYLYATTLSESPILGQQLITADLDNVALPFIAARANGNNDDDFSSNTATINYTTLAEAEINTWAEVSQRSLSNDRDLAVTSTNARVVVSQSAMLEANNAEKYKVTYDDGVADNDAVQVVSGTMPTDITQYAPNATVQVTTTVPTRQGYVFRHWENMDSTTTVVEFDTRIKDVLSSNLDTSFSMPSENVTLTAMWAKEKDGCALYSFENGADGLVHVYMITQNVDTLGNETIEEVEVFYREDSSFLDINIAREYYNGLAYNAVDNNFYVYYTSCPSGQSVLYNGKKSSIKRVDFTKDGCYYLTNVITDMEVRFTQSGTFTEKGYYISQSVNAVYNCMFLIADFSDPNSSTYGEHIIIDCYEEESGVNLTTDTSDVSYWMEDISIINNVGYVINNYGDSAIFPNKKPVFCGDTIRSLLYFEGLDTFDFNDPPQGFILKKTGSINFYNSSDELNKQGVHLSYIDQDSSLYIGVGTREEHFNFYRFSYDQLEKIIDGTSPTLEMNSIYNFGRWVSGDGGGCPSAFFSPYLLLYDDGVTDGSVDSVPYQESYFEGKEVTVNDYIPKRPGYSFEGWKNLNATYYASDSTTVRIPAGVIYVSDTVGPDFRMPNAHVTLTAMWRSSTHEIVTNFVNNIGETSAHLTGTIVSGTDIEEYGFVWSYTDNHDLTLDNGDSMIRVYTVPTGQTGLSADAIGTFSIADTSFVHRANVYFRAYLKINTADADYAYGKVIRFLTEKRDFSLSLDGASHLLLDKASTAATINRLTGKNFSIDFWMKNKGAGDASQTILANAMSQGRGYEVCLDTAGRISVNNGTGAAVTSVAITDNEWHHVAIVSAYGGANTIIYVDSIASSMSIDLVEPTSGAVLTIGASTSTSGEQSNHFTGNLDALRFWDVALSSEAISILCNDNLEEGDNANVAMIGAGTEVGSLPWTTLLASFDFNVKSTREPSNDQVPTVYDTQDDLHNYPFFHENARLASDSIAFNIVAIGNAKPSPDLPRVNWRHNASTDAWLFSDNWSGSAYPGEGVSSLELFHDLEALSDDTVSNAEYVILNVVDTDALKPVITTGIFPHGSDDLAVNHLIDREDTLGTYIVSGASPHSGCLKILKGVAQHIFGVKVLNANSSVIVIDQGSIEPDDSIY